MSNGLRDDTPWWKASPMLSCNKLPNALFLLTGLPLLWLSIPHSFVVPAGQHIAKQQTHLLDSQHGKMGCGGHCLFIDNNDFKSKAVLNTRIQQKAFLHWFQMQGDLQTLYVETHRWWWRIEYHILFRDFQGKYHSVVFTPLSALFLLIGLYTVRYPLALGLSILAW